MIYKLSTKQTRLFLFVFLLSTTFLFAQNQTAKLTPVSQIGYYEYLPPDYNLNTNNYPIVIFFHGLGERGNGTTEITKVSQNGPPKFVKFGTQFPFILISPQLKTTYGTWPTWYMDEVVEHVRSYLRVDPSRIYITGLSLGGGGAWEYGYNFPQKVAALVPVCGGYNALSKACILAANKIPIWASHGDKDTTVPMSKTVNMVNAINACIPAISPAPILTIYPNVAHNAWDYAYRTDHSLHNPNVYEWMMGFTKDGVSVSAGLDLVLNLPTNSTTIAGIASTSSGTISSYTWTKLTGAAVTLTNASSSIVSLSAMVAGVYTFRLTVTNSLGQSNTDDVKVTVTSGNQNPIANSGGNKTITLPTNSVTLNGSGSDPDGSVSSYLWTKVSGPAAGTLSGQATPTLSLTALAQGTYVFSLTVTDNLGATASANATVTVNPAAVNQVPIAPAGSNKTINLPTNSTTLVGSGTDPDGSIASYLWEKLSGPSVTITNSTSSTVSLSNLVVGVYTFRITVTDNLGATGTAQVTVTVVAANQAPVANAGSAITITLPTNTTNIVGSGTDPDGSISSYSWTQVSGPNSATLTNASNPTLTASNLLQGVYSFRLTVTDNLGATGLANVSVTVNAVPVNVAPTANAGADNSITLPTNMITLPGSGNDLDGSIASYSWIIFSGPGATLTNQNTNTLTATNMVAGTYVFRLTVTDNQGATGLDNVTIVVQPAAVNQSPTVNVGSDFSLTLPTNSTTISSVATDPDGTISTYTWTKVSGPAVTIANANTSTVSLSGMVAGNYVFQLEVTDNLGANANDQVTVTVSTSNQPPVVSANNEIITLPISTTNLIAVASDPDGSIASYLWINTSGPGAAILTGATTNSLGVSGLIAGTYVFKITVTDNQGATAFHDVNVVVQTVANQSPSANAGMDKSITLPTNSTNFVGSGIDTDGTITTYSWSQVSGGALILSNANTQTLSVSGALVGSFILRLTVTDNNGSTGSDDVMLTVNPAAVNQNPVANAGANPTITLPQNTLNLTGSGNDPDGSIATYLWTKLSGPTATLTNSASAIVSLSNLVEGTYVFRLLVTDNLGATAFDDAIVNVLPATVNQPPVANAGADITLTLPLNGSTLFGGGSDPDGSIASYSWTKLTGGAVTLTNATTPTLTIADLVQGVYVFRLLVTDNLGATANDDITIVVNAVATNQAPVANAGSDKVIALPTNTTNLNGSGSDADGSIAIYDWVKISGPTVTLGATNGNTLSLSDLMEGIYVFQLMVTDDYGATGTDNTMVTVNPASVNQAPVVSAGSDKSIFLPINTVQFSGSASDSDGSIITQVWTQTSGPTTTTLVNATSTLLTVNNLAEGIYSFRFTATDDKSASTFDEVQVIVNSATANQPPAANAGSDQTIKLPLNNILLAGLGTDIDGTVVTYAWTKVSGPTCTLANQNTATLAVTNMAEGIYTFQLMVTDNLGTTGSDNVKITVLSASINTSPQVSAGVDVNVVLPATTAILTGTASDDGAITTTVWTKVSGPAATLSGSNSSVLSLSTLTAGTYIFKLTVTDDGGLSNSDDATVVVFPQDAANLPPAVDAGEDKLLQLPTNSVSIVAAAEDPDGIINGYKWTQFLGNPIIISPDDTNELTLTNLQPGSYSFVVTVTDGEGLTASDEVQVNVREQDPVAKPFNTFSPDGKGDLKTETWHIDNSDLIADCDIMVYNREGIKVFETRGYATEWNGTYNGKILPSAVYFYVISCSGQSKMNGSVTIIY